MWPLDRGLGGVHGQSCRLVSGARTGDAVICHNRCASRRVVDERAQTFGDEIGSGQVWQMTGPVEQDEFGAAAAFAFLISFDDVVIAIFVAGPNSTTLPKRMWETIRFEIDPTLTAIASLLTVIAIVVLVTGELFRRADPSERSD